MVALLTNFNDPVLRVYRDILRGRQLGTAAYWGARGNEDGSMTLFLEFVEGRRLKRCDETGAWIEAARWLGRMHRTFTGNGSLTGLPPYDTDFYLAWAHRALESASRVSPEAAMQLRRIVSSYDKVARPLGEAEWTLVHGEFYCTNIMVQNSQAGIRVCPFDWETAAAGCGALDLAYLLRQKLGITDACLNEAYREGWREAGGCDLDAGELQARRVHVAGLRVGVVRALQHVEVCAVQRGGMDADEDLPWTRRRHVDVADLPVWRDASDERVGCIGKNDEAGQTDKTAQRIDPARDTDAVDACLDDV